VDERVWTTILQPLYAQLTDPELAVGTMTQ
jgi:hypothetical protein